MELSLLDPSDWKALGEKVVVKSSSKAFYNKYLFSLKWDCYLAHWLRARDSKYFDLDKRIKHHNEARKAYGSLIHISSELEGQLHSSLNAINSLDSTEHKVRIEYNYIAVYSNNENELFELAKNLVRYPPHTHLIIERPPVDKIEGFLSGSVSVSVPYKYKIETRGMRLPLQLRTALYNSLSVDEVKLNDTLRKTLTSRISDSIPKSYFYSNDLSVLTMLNLICPHFVQKIRDVVTK